MTSVEKGGKVGSAAPNSIRLTFMNRHEKSKVATIRCQIRTRFVAKHSTTT
jgi:hypothetical protein